MKCHLYNIESFVIYNLHKILSRMCHKLVMQHQKIYKKYIEEIEKKNEVIE